MATPGGMVERVLARAVALRVDGRGIPAREVERRLQRHRIATGGAAAHRGRAARLGGAHQWRV
eukprot:4702727-Prymnesium_polylepis.3